MRWTGLLLALPIAAAAIVPAPDARACGGCFVQQSEDTQVTGHRMILSVSQDQTTLYDQIEYAGAPEEFAWVLPIRGQVDVGLSSDALFASLEAATKIVIASPSVSCPAPNSCDDGSLLNTVSAGPGGGMEEPGVEILVQEVVGPYETVQLAAEDPQALIAWLEGHGYNIPDDVQPIIDAYVDDGFGFLALRLLPGEGIAAMKPVAVSMPGAGATLPLKMVAAGTGAVTPVSLWVIGEGRYEPQNFPHFLIDAGDLIWSWEEARSNYSEIKSQGFADSDGFAWLTEAAEPIDPYVFDQLIELAESDPANSGYGDADGSDAVEAASADVERLLSGIDRDSMWVTRLTAELSREALSDDLALQASADQTILERYLLVEEAVGTPPPCPPNPPVDCEDDDGSDDGGTGGTSRPGSEPSCSASTTQSSWSLFGIAGLISAVWALSFRRRRKRD